MLKKLILAITAFFALALGPAHAEMPQTDVDLVKQMEGADSSKILQALSIYYDLHVSELTVQNMNEQRTGAMFAMMRARGSGANAGKLANLEKKSQLVAAKRKAQIKANRDLRIKLEEVSGIEFLDNLVMAPDAPMAQPSVPAGAPDDLVAAQSQAWKEFEVSHAAWQEERLILLDAQQRYDETRDVPIGDHLRAMTRAEIAYAKAIGACRLIAAKIAVATGQPLAEALGSL